MTGSAHNLRLIGHHDLAGQGDLMHVNVVNGHAFIGHMGTNSVGTSVLDVSDPRRPELVAQITPPPGTHTHKVQVVDDLLLVNHERNRFADDPREWSAGLAIYDVSRPASPKQIGFFPAPGSGVHRMTYWEAPYAYLSASAEGYRGRILRIVDLSDPTAPTEVGRWFHPGQAPGPDQGQGLPSETDGHPAVVSLHHALVFGDRAYCGWQDTGLVILDVADKTAPKLVSHVDFGPGSAMTHSALAIPSRDLLVVTDEQITRHLGIQRHVRVLDISDESAPVEISKLPVPPGDYHERKIRFGPHNLHEPRPGSYQSDTHVYLTYFAGGVRVYDLSDPTAPEEVAWYVPETPAGRHSSQINDVTVTPEGLVFITDRNGAGLYILEQDI